MPAKIKEVGNIYGKWTIIEEIPVHQRENRALAHLAQCECGTIRPVRISDLRSGKSKSCGCSSKKDWHIIIGQTYGELTVLKQLVNRHGNLIQQYECQCSCGNKIVLPADLINKKKNCGCKYMEGFDILDEMLNKHFGHLTVIQMSDRIDKYGKKSYRICQCDCGNVIEVQARHLRTGHTSSCGCTISFGEEYVASFLKSHNISYIRQYRFNDLQDKKELPFDLVITQDDTIIGAIEVQGKQHYQSDLLFYSEDLIKHDKMKEEYCKQKNIPLLLLDYSKGNECTNFQEWDQILIKFLEEFKCLTKEKIQ